MTLGTDSIRVAVIASPGHLHRAYRWLVPPVRGGTNPFTGAGPKVSHRISFSKY